GVDAQVAVARLRLADLQIDLAVGLAVGVELLDGLSFEDVKGAGLVHVEGGDDSVAVLGVGDGGAAIDRPAFLAVEADADDAGTWVGVWEEEERLGLLTEAEVAVGALALFLRLTVGQRVSRELFAGGAEADDEFADVVERVE